MSKRWNNTEELKLIELYAKGQTYNDIGKKLNRSPNAIRLKLESIVYENITKGKTIKLLMKMLNTTDETIKQLYYSHKSFKQSKGIADKPIDIEKKNNTNTKNIQTIEQENYVLEILVKNSKLKHELNELYKNKLLDSHSVNIYKKICQ
jgi:hypothetical protein